MKREKYIEATYDARCRCSPLKSRHFIMSTRDVMDRGGVGPSSAQMGCIHRHQVQDGTLCICPYIGPQTVSSWSCLCPGPAAPPFFSSPQPSFVHYTGSTDGRRGTGGGTRLSDADADVDAGEGEGEGPGKGVGKGAKAAAPLASARAM